MNILEYENYQELKEHFENTFSYNTYLCTIPLDFSRVPCHWHNEMELIYIKKGYGKVGIDLTDYTVSAGEIAIILPGQLHSIEQADDTSFEYENIMFDMNLISSKQGDSITDALLHRITHHTIHFPSILMHDTPYYNDLIGYIDRADEICKTFPQCYSLGIKSQLCGFFYLLVQTSSDSSPVKPDIRSLKKIKLITQYIEENYQSEISIEKMAEICDFSQSHFMKFFKKNMGIPFISYLNEYRLIIASRLLLTSSSSIIYIAQECGFDNLSYFNRLFRKKFSMTPSQFRHQQS